jgi:glutaredoxin
LTIYSKPGCHLCEEMKVTIHRVVLDPSISIDEIDISKDPALSEQYGLDIPVLMIDGKKVAKYRVSEGELRRIIESRLGIRD